jgi:hypothetical protein
MSKSADKVEVQIEEVKESAPSANGSSVVLETEAKVNGSLHDTAIEVAQTDVPAVAVALLNTEAGAVGPVNGLPQAIHCLGAGVVHGVGQGSVRFHLQFDSGQVLPIEMSRDAALALGRGLFQHLSPIAGFEMSQWGLPAS